MIPPRVHLQRLHARGVELRLREGQLDVKGSISDGERVVLRALHVFGLLRDAPGGGVELVPGTDPAGPSA